MQVQLQNAIAKHNCKLAPSKIEDDLEGKPTGGDLFMLSHLEANPYAFAFFGVTRFEVLLYCETTKLPWVTT